MIRQEYRGHTIDADTDTDGAWVALVDGDERGRPQRSRSDALREAKASVNRSLAQRGQPLERVRMELATDDSYFASLRDAIRDKEPV